MAHSNQKKHDIEVVEIKAKRYLEEAGRWNIIQERIKGYGWKLWKEHRGKVVIRCQSKKHGTNPPEQCKETALNGHYMCRVHCKGRAGKRAKAVEEIKKEIGVYDIKDGALQKQLKDIETLDPKQLESVMPEIKLSLALLREFLKRHTDEQIMKNSGRLMWLLDNIARFKKTQYDMQHAKEVTFTIQQVNYLFLGVKNVLISEIKDIELLKKVAKGIDKFGIELKEDGFKVR